MVRHGIKTDGASTAGVARGWMARAGAATLVLGLTACSSLPDLPDYANPVEWYNSSTEMVGGWFKDDEPKIEAASAGKSATDKAGGDKSKKDDEKFPSLSSVPAKPTASSDAEARAKLTNQLAADRANARYTDEKPKASAPKIETKAAASPKPPADPVVTSVEKVAAPKPTVAAPAPAPSPSASQLARLPSSVYQGKRSNLWPNAPAPGPATEAATTSARVGRPVVSSTGQISSSSSTLSNIPRPPAAASDSMAKDAETKDNMTAAPATQSAAAPIAPPAPEIPPKFTLTPPSASASAPTDERETNVNAATPTFQLTPPRGMTAASEGEGEGEGDQPMLRFDTFDRNGAAGVVNFGHGSSQISSADLAKLRAVAETALSQGLYVRVVGHASMRTRDMDPFEHTLANFNVSLKRANAVAGALLEMGVPAEQLIIDAVGDTEPLFSEAMPSGEQGNRRAEIYLES